MIKKLTFAMALFSVTQFSYAEVDWTPKLTILQESCSNTFHMMEELPSKYQASIIKKGDVKVKDKYSGYNITTTYYLKDAIAFGLPLDKIEEEINDSDMHSKTLSLVFKDSAFMKLRPSFYYTPESQAYSEYKITADMPSSATYRNADEGVDVTYKNTALGYVVEDKSDEYMTSYTTLHFNKSNKSISCSSSY